MTAIVAAIFAVLVALPLSEGFFEDWGMLTGPAAWIVAALATGRLLGLALRVVALAAAASGALAAAVGLGLEHTAGLVVGLAAFGIATGALGGRVPSEREPTAA